MFLRFSEEFFIDSEEPSRFVRQLSGHLVVIDEDDFEHEAGAFDVMMIDVIGAINEGESVFEVFDSNGITMDYYATLYASDTDDFKPKVAKIACGDEYIWNPNLLILDRLIVYPQFRGRCIGLLALRGLIQRMRAGVGLIAMKPFPLQFESTHLDRHNSDKSKKFALDAFNLPKNRATAKLKKYYARLGFKPVPTTEYMVLSPEISLPKIDVLIATINK